MTIRAKLESLLVSHGLWPDEAAAVVKEMEVSETSQPMRDRWDEHESYYPKTLIAVLWAAAKDHAVKWIDTNKPQHFARGILTQP